jgi:predicted MFS family arabinose efflux permease
MLTVLPWRSTMVILGLAGLAIAAAIFLLTPRPAGAGAAAHAAAERTDTAAPAPPRRGFPLLLSIGVLDSATRMAFLTFLPFVLIAKGAGLPTIGAALTLVFAGGAFGKLVCTFIGQRFGAFFTVILTEAATALGILALIPLGLEAALVLLPLIGVALNGTSSVLYGSVPALVEPHKRARAFSIFYTGTIGSGAVSPLLFGAVGDALSLVAAVVLVACLALLTLPLAVALRPALFARG